MDPLIVPLDAIGLKDLAEVGEKNASLEEMITHLGPSRIRIPANFALTMVEAGQDPDPESVAQIHYS